MAEFREDPQRNANLRGPIVENLRAAGLQKDCPFPSSGSAAPSDDDTANSEAEEDLTAEAASSIPVERFAEYAGQLNSYLQVGLACI